MNHHSFFKTAVLLCLLAAVLVSEPIFAAEESETPTPAPVATPAPTETPTPTATPAPAATDAPRRPGGRGIWGDWDLKVQFGERDMDVILSVSRDESGSLTGDWVGFWGVSRLEDFTFADGKLSFVQVGSFGDEPFRLTFKGTVEEGELKGVLSGDRGDSNVTGQRHRRPPRAVGTWELKYKVGDRDITSKLIIKADDERELSAQWTSEEAQVEVSDLNYERGTLTCKRKTTMGDRTWDSTFEGSINRETGLLEGTIKSSEGEPIAVKGKRMGEALIGTWNLDVTGDEREYKQQLRVNPDMSGRYGTLAIDKIELKDDAVSFEAEWGFGDRTFEMQFEGKLADDKLAGQMTTSRGTQKVEGTKIVRRFRRPRPAVTGGSGG